VQKLDDGTPYLVSYLSGDVDRETLTSTELGFVNYWLERRLLLDAKAFWERTEDVIHFADDQSLSQPIPVPVPIPVVMNDGNREVQGVELQLKYETTPHDFLSIQHAVLDTDITYRAKINPDVARFEHEPVIPNHTTSILASKSLPAGFEISGAWYRLSRMVWLGGGDRLAYYDRYDARLARRWRSGSSRMMLEAIVQNPGSEYITFRDENKFDTRGFLRFTVEFD
jgi:iron complex outermembrane receptor protein